MIIVGYWPQDGVISDSRGMVMPVIDLGNVIDMLLEPYRVEGQTTWKLAWDIDDLAIPIVKLLPPEHLQRLAETEACELYIPTKWGGSRRVRIWYPRNEGVGQCLAINDKSNQNEVIIWHLGSFIPDGVEPPRNAPEVEEYARKILRIFAKQLGYEPRPGNFFSPVNVLKPYVKAMSLPKLADLPDKAANYASKCMSPPWVEAHQVGYWQKVYDYDLTNAYAGILRDLPDWRLGEWREGKDFQPDAMLGYCICDCTIRPEAVLHPIITELEDGRVVSGVGLHKEKPLTKAQINFIRKWQLGTVDILDGVWWYPAKVRQPLKTVISRLSDQREQMARTESQVDRILGRYEAKKAMVGLWGYTARWEWEKGKEPDEFYNPPWAAEITTRVPLKVADFIYRKKAVRNVINIAVDGFPSDHQIPLTPEDIAAGWKESYVGPCLSLSDTHSWLSDKKPEGIHLDAVLKMITAKPSNIMWARQFKRRATLGDATLRRKLGIIGSTIVCRSTLHLKQDRSRVFRREPKTGRDLLTKKYRSKPFDMKGVA